tara:strand:+ start:943 stop:1161 length:219 start_codon:yes stop_codon:yes gene_type:complete
MKAINAGKTHPKLWVENGIHCVMESNRCPRFSDAKKSGILKIKVTNTTPLKTIDDVNLLETTFNKIKTIVIG